MFKGIIYKISSTNKNIAQLYIGQSYSSNQNLTPDEIKEKRWSTHIRDKLKLAANEALRVVENKPSRRESGKAAKLHKMMITLGEENMKIDVLESFEFEDKNELLNKLDERENYFIDRYDSIKNGWNKIKAKNVKRPLGVSPKETWGVIASRHGVPQRRLQNRVNNGLTIEEAVKEIKEADKKPIRILSYGKQTFDKTSDLKKEFHKHNIPLRTLQSRIRNYIKKEKKKETGKIVFDEESNTETIYLNDSIFAPVADLSKEITVNTPDGEESGNITQLHEKLLPKYPDIISKAYTTPQSRLNKGWNPDQAFGFRYPPDFEKVESLIKEKGYEWGEIDGTRKIPDFREDHKGKTKPIIMHEIKTVYFSEKDWCDAYKLKDRKTIKKLFDQGKSPEDVLRHYKKTI